MSLSKTYITFGCHFQIFVVIFVMMPNHFRSNFWSDFRNQNLTIFANHRKKTYSTFYWQNHTSDTFLTIVFVPNTIPLSILVRYSHFILFEKFLSYVNYRYFPAETLYSLSPTTVIYFINVYIQHIILIW